MSMMLTLTEMHKALEIAVHPLAPHFAKRLSDLQNAMTVEFKERLEKIANDMAAELRVTTGAVSLPAYCNGNQLNETCVSFSPARDGDPVPTLISTFDSYGDWTLQHDGVGRVLYGRDTSPVQKALW